MSFYKRHNIHNFTWVFVEGIFFYIICMQCFTKISNSVGRNDNFLAKAEKSSILPTSLDILDIRQHVYRYFFIYYIRVLYLRLSQHNLSHIMTTTCWYRSEMAFSQQGSYDSGQWCIYVLPGAFTPVVEQAFFPKPLTTFSHMHRGERRKVVGKKWSDLSCKRYTIFHGKRKVKQGYRTVGADINGICGNDTHLRGV